MTTIRSIIIEVAEPEAAETFYMAAFDVAGRVRIRAAAEPATGFRGFVPSLVVSQPAAVRGLIDRAADAGASVLKPAAKSLWGYGGVVQAPDGTIWSIASSSKKDTRPATKEIDTFVLQLGVDDVATSKEFYTSRGFTVTRSFGRRYVEFDTGQVKLTLNKRAALAKTIGIPADGTGPHGLAITSDSGSFTDPDGFEWEAAAG